jgi:hypothetical protein
VPSSPRITEQTFTAKHSTVTIQRPAPGVVVIVVTGTDVGEHGAGPFKALANDLAEGQFELFVDARASRGVTVDVSAEWAVWLSGKRASLHGVTMLTGSRFVQLSVNFVQRFAELGDLMRVYTESAAFEQALATAVAEARDAAVSPA